MKVEIHTGNLEKEYFDNFTVAIFTDFYDRDILIEINNYMRSKGKGFIYGGLLGILIFLLFIRTLWFHFC